MRGIRSFMGWHKIPEFKTVSSSDDNPFAGTCVQPTSKVSVKLPVDDWLCRKMGKLNLTITEGYPARNTDTAGLLKDQFIKPPRSSKWYGMHTEKKDCESNTVCTWSPEPAKLNHSFSRVARKNLPSTPPSRAFSQDMLRRWERAAREQTVMCYQAAGLSRCLTRVQDAQLKTLHLDKKGKFSERTKQAIDKLDYLVTFDRSISQPMARTMQDLSEGVFISMANFTLARRDSYLKYLYASVKQDTLNALKTSSVHLNSLFPDQLITKAEEDTFSCSLDTFSCSRGQESDFKFECRLLCCKCSYCHRVATRKGINPNCCQMYTEIKYVKVVSFVGHLSSVNLVTNAPTCCHQSTCRGKVTQVLGEVGSFGFESKSSHHTERGLHPPLPVQTKLDQVTNCHKQLPQPGLWSITFECNALP